MTKLIQEIPEENKKLASQIVTLKPVFVSNEYLNRWAEKLSRDISKEGSTNHIKHNPIILEDD